MNLSPEMAKVVTVSTQTVQQGPKPEGTQKGGGGRERESHNGEPAISMRIGGNINATGKT